MTDTSKAISPQGPRSEFPTISFDDDNKMKVELPDNWSAEVMMGMHTYDAAIGVLTTAINALGNGAKQHANLASAMFVELEPRDAIEAMLIAQMTATHVAITTMSARVTCNDRTDVRESLERSMTRLSRSYLAQMSALKKHRAKAQQLVRVERVTVQEGGQAIVGNVTPGERG